MNAKGASCPPESVLSDFGLGKLDAARADTVSRHLDTCTDCRDRVAGLSGDSFVDRLRNVPGYGSVSEQPASQSAPAIGSAPIDAPPAELASHPDYDVLKELGRGGMGVVYLARNRMMDRLEVLKVVSTSLLERPGALERFQQEIRSAARLSHANIVAAHSVLRLGSLLVFVMEYVDGEDLAEVVKRRGALPVAHAAFYAHQVALGLQHAHEKGMVHRDIKPSNLMLSVDAKKHVVKILDFGLAKATSEKGADAGLTKIGQILGTPDYLAPEQTLAAHKSDIRADIYSLGCTLYYLLSGAPPFPEASLYEILKAHQAREAKRLNLVRPEVPVEMAMVVAKMMAKDPGNRYQTPIDVARALGPFFKPGRAASPAESATSASKVELPRVAAEAAPQVERSAAPTPFAPAPPPVPQNRRLPVAPTAPIPVPPPPVQRAPDLDITIETRRCASLAKVRRSRWASDSPRQRLAAGGAALLLLLGIVFGLSTKEELLVVKKAATERAASAPKRGKNPPPRAAATHDPDKPAAKTKPPHKGPQDPNVKLQTADGPEQPQSSRSRSSIGRQRVDKAIADMVREHGAERVVTINVQGLPDAEITIVDRANQKTVQKRTYVEPDSDAVTTWVYDWIRALSRSSDSAASQSADGFSIVVAPLTDIRDLADKLDVGMISNVDDANRVITIRADPKELASRQSQALTVRLEGVNNIVSFVEAKDRPETGEKSVKEVNKKFVIRVVRGQSVLVDIRGVDNSVYIPPALSENIKVHNTGINNTVVRE